ncbi:MAG: hypothetical protein HY328_05900, partial [Chloroflexi bacterium]|nr:hypothetical protein [Chloroflexota bacterium]
MTASSPTPPKHPLAHVRTLWPWLIALICLAAAGGWLVLRTAQPSRSFETPRQTTSLASGVVARMDSPAFTYSDGWEVSPAGADPAEPDDAWNEPAGRLTFAYGGRELALQLAVGNYWGYIFVTVDGAPANRLASIPGNANSLGEAAGYKPLLAPERQTDEGQATLWVPVHSADDDGPHTVQVEVWRGWGQIPLRGLAVDALPAPPRPLWPAALFGLGAIWSLYFGIKIHSLFQSVLIRPIRQIRVLFFRAILQARLLATGDEKTQTPQANSLRYVFFNRIVPFWPVALLLIGAGVVADNWLLTDAGLALLALAALLRPELWVAALLFGLPFYLHPLPILPGRALNLIEIGVWGGLAILVMRNGECGMQNGERHLRNTQYAIRTAQS